MLYTSIPHFHNTLISSFSCEHCGESNRDVQQTSVPKSMGTKILVKLANAEDLKRQVIVSEYASIRILELDLECPKSHKSFISTCEGILQNILVDLKSIDSVTQS